MANDVRIGIFAQDQTKGAFDSAAKNAHGLGKVLGDVGKIAGGFLAANVISAGVSAFTGFIGGSVREATKLGESLNAVNKIFGDSAGTILDWGKKNATSFGLSQQAFNELATPMGAVLKNLGFSADQVADQTINLTKRAADLASVFNTDVDEALAAINSALRGEANPIERYGVSVNAAAVELRALADTGKKTASTLTDNEKAAARLAIIFDQTASSAGDFADTSNQLANATRIQKARQEELQATIGTKLVPIMLKVTEIKLKLVEAIATKLIPLLEELSAKHWPAVSEAINKVVAVVQEHWPIISDVVGFVFDFVKTKIGGFIQQAQGIVEIVESTVDLVRAIFHGDWRRAWEEMKDIAGGIIDLFIGQIKVMFGNLPDILYNLGKDAGKALLKGITDTASGLLNKLDLGVNLGFNANPFRQHGGPVMAGLPYVVGERGAELFVPGSSGAVIPAAGHRDAAFAQPSVVNVYVSGSILSERDITRIVRDAILGGGFRGVIGAV